MARGIVARGETPPLHTAEGNTGAVRLYGALGFRPRRRTRFLMVRAPRAPREERASADGTATRLPVG